MSRYQDKVVWITGASSGIGEALVTQFVAQGAHVGFVDVDVSAGEALVRLGVEGSSLIVTVDCGAMAHEALAMAHEAGVDVIVVDTSRLNSALREILGAVPALA